MKTLIQYLTNAATPVRHTWTRGHCVILPYNPNHVYRDIFALDDFKVQSVEGGSYWLAPATDQAAEITEIKCKLTK